MFLLLELLHKKGYLFWFAVISMFNYLVLASVDYQVSVLVFCLFAIISGFTWYFYMTKKPKYYEQTGYERNSHDYVRREFVLSNPMIDGKSEIMLDDSVWPVYARKEIDLPTGARVKVIKTNGVILIVKPVMAFDPDSLSI